jgi:Integrin beta chain VWA domain
MDLSSTMKSDKHRLSELGYTLGTEMQKISKDFHLGFGSFVDKTVIIYSLFFTFLIEIWESIGFTFDFCFANFQVLGVFSVESKKFRLSSADAAVPHLQSPS